MRVPLPVGRLRRTIIRVLMTQSGLVLVELTAPADTAPSMLTAMSLDPGPVSRPSRRWGCEVGSRVTGGVAGEVTVKAEGVAAR